MSRRGLRKDHLPSLVRPVIALVTDPYKGARPDVGVTDDAAAIALFTQTSDGNASLKYK